MRTDLYKSQFYDEVYDAQEVEHYLRAIKDKEIKVIYWGTGTLGSGYAYQALKKRNIIPVYYCDNNKDKWNKVVVDDIYCFDFKKMTLEKDDFICVITVSSLYIPDVLLQLKNMGIKHVLPYDVLFRHLCVEQDYCDFLKKEKIAVYTCIVNNYDDYQEPEFGSDIYDYFLISDKKPGNVSNYEWIDIRTLVPGNISDYTRMNRYCKINAHKIFPNYRRSIYHDGNIQIRGDMISLFEKLKKTRIGVACRHMWNSFYEESVPLIELKSDKVENIYNQVKQYWLEGFPESFGLAHCCVLMREHNNHFCIKLMETWWDELEKQSKRDQLSFAYAVWKNGYTMDDVLFLTENVLQNPYWNFKKEHNLSRLRNIQN